jgi:hypothetical protein
MLGYMQKMAGWGAVGANAGTGAVMSQVLPAVTEQVGLPNLVDKITGDPNPEPVYTAQQQALMNVSDQKKQYGVKTLAGSPSDVTSRSNKQLWTGPYQGVLEEMNKAQAPVDPYQRNIPPNTAVGQYPTTPLGTAWGQNPPVGPQGDPQFFRPSTWTPESISNAGRLALGMVTKSPAARAAALFLNPNQLGEAASQAGQGNLRPLAGMAAEQVGSYGLMQVLSNPMSAANLVAPVVGPALVAGAIAAPMLFIENSSREMARRKRLSDAKTYDPKRYAQMHASQANTPYGYPGFNDPSSHWTTQAEQDLIDSYYSSSHWTTQAKQDLIDGKKPASQPDIRNPAQKQQDFTGFMNEVNQYLAQQQPQTSTVPAAQPVVQPIQRSRQ